MSELALATLLLGIALPHRLNLAGAPPVTAALLWSANLALRALAGVLVAIYLVLYLPSTQLFSVLTHWCWHGVLPLLATHLGLSGHRIGDAAAVLPTAIIALSAVWAAYGVVRVARSVQRLLKRSSLGPGRSASLILGGERWLNSTTPSWRRGWITSAVISRADTVGSSSTPRRVAHWEPSSPAPGRRCANWLCTWSEMPTTGRSAAATTVWPWPAPS